VEASVEGGEKETLAAHYLRIVIALPACKKGLRMSFGGFLGNYLHCGITEVRKRRGSGVPVIQEKGKRASKESAKKGNLKLFRGLLCRGVTGDKGTKIKKTYFVPKKATE
jgi:hypothetical protein